MAMQGEKLRWWERERLIVQLKGSGRWGYVAAGGVNGLPEILERPRY
jgi:hypothetical protein